MCFFEDSRVYTSKKCTKRGYSMFFVEHIALILAAVLAGTVTGIIATRR